MLTLLTQADLAPADPRINSAQGSGCAEGFVALRLSPWWLSWCDHSRYRLSYIGGGSQRWQSYTCFKLRGFSHIFLYFYPAFLVLTAAWLRHPQVGLLIHSKSFSKLHQGRWSLKYWLLQLISTTPMEPPVMFQGVPATTRVCSSWKIIICYLREH